MVSPSCANCGSAIEYPARFCRRCGRPLDSSEVETRAFDEPARPDAVTRPANPITTSPTYMPPGALPPNVMPPQQAPAAAGFEPSGQKKTVIVLASLIAILIIAIVTLAIVLLNKGGGTSAGPPPPGSGTRAPDSPPPPPQPPPEQPGLSSQTPAAPPAGKPGEISRDLFYPGAEVFMDLPTDDGVAVILTASEPLEKVVEWYTAKLKATVTSRSQSNVTLTGNGIVVIIYGYGNATGIALTKEKKL